MVTCEISDKLFETIPLVMQIIRTELPSATPANLTISQFRVLSNREIADQHGLSQPAISRLVEGLVQKKLIRRTPCIKDRRALKLELAKKGKSLFKEIKGIIGFNISQRLSRFSKNELGELYCALFCLHTFLNRLKKVEQA